MPAQTIKLLKTNFIQTPLDEFTYRSDQLVSIITTNITGWGSIFKVHVSISLPDVKYPALMVESVRKQTTMISTGKFHMKFFFEIYWYFTGNDRLKVRQYQVEAGEALEKLFSNNAFGDLATANTKRYKLNPGFWVNSEMTGVVYSPSLRFSQPSNQTSQVLRAGKMSLWVEDVVVK